MDESLRPGAGVSLTAAPLDEPGVVPTVLVVDDDPDIRALLRRWLRLEGFHVECVESGEAAMQCLTRMLPHAVCLDLELPGSSGLQTLRQIKAQNPRLPVLILTANGAIDAVVTAMRDGAWDYLVKPVDRMRLATTLRNAVEHNRMAVQVAQLQREAGGRGGFARMVGDSPPMRALFRQIDRVAPTSVTVLIRGESGTGKELVARAIHDGSARREAPFVALNCAAVPETLQESELFGHEKGAFTGAATRFRGRFEQAHQGTLFLDEVAELSLALQAKLLRVLQERTFHRVGGSQETVSDFRLIAASHRDLAAEVAAGRFREDLYFRLAVFELDVPPLRQRGRDVLLLAETFLATFTRDRALLTLSAAAQQTLMNHRWPGNVRELRNAMERAAVVASGTEVTLEDLPSRVTQPQPEQGPRPSVAVSETPPSAGPDASVAPLDAVEREAIFAALRQTNGNRTEAGERLGISRSTLYRRLKKYNTDNA